LKHNKESEIFVILYRNAMFSCDWRAIFHPEKRLVKAHCQLLCVWGIGTFQAERMDEPQVTRRMAQ
jgi:hypothetical protein